MKNNLVFGFTVMAICFLIDSTITFFVPFDFTRQGIVIVPYVGTLMFCLLVMKIDYELRSFFSVIVGLYYSIVYADSLTIYVVFYLLLSYISVKYLKSIHCSYLEFVLAGISTIFVFEVVLYLIMWLANITNMTIYSYLIGRLLPTLVLGLVSTVPVYLIYNTKRFGDDDGEYAYYGKRN